MHTTMISFVLAFEFAFAPWHMAVDGKCVELLMLSALGAQSSLSFPFGGKRAKVNVLNP